MPLSAEQHALRRTGIGGSEIAAVAGLSPFATPLDVWRSKREGHAVLETQPMRRGRLLEPAVAEWYAEVSGARLREVGTLRHLTRHIVLATPDRIATLGGAERVLEIKTTHLHNPDAWGPPGTDAVPPWHLAQVAWTMAAADLPSADLAVLIAGDDFRVYHFERDLELEGYLFELAEGFWQDHILTGTPPPLDASDSCANWLRHRYPRETGPVLKASAEAERWMASYREATVRLEAAKQEQQLARNSLEALIENAAGLEGDGWRISWRRTRDTLETNWQAVAREAGVSGELIKKYTTVRPGPRVFRPTWRQL